MRIPAAVCRTCALPMMALLTLLGDATAHSNRELPGHIGGVKSVAFSPDSSLLVTVGFDGRVKIWDVAQGAEVAILKETRMDTNCAQFSPDGKLLATGHRERIVILWDLESGSALKSLPVSGPRDLFEVGEGHEGPVNSVAFSVEGTLLATGSDDTKVKIWDIAAGKEVTTLQGHKSNVSKVSFHPQTKLLASGSMDGTLIVWSVVNWIPHHRIRVADAQPHPVDMDLQFSPDGKSIAISANNEIKLYDTSTGVALSPLGRGARVAFRRDKKHIAHGSGVRDVQLRQLPTGDPIQTLTDHRGRVTCLAFSPDGKSLAVGNATSGVIKLWDLSSVDSNAAPTEASARGTYASLGDRGSEQADLAEFQQLASSSPLHFENRPILHFDVSTSVLFGQQFVTIARKPDGGALKTLKQTHSPVWRPQGDQFAYFRESEQGGRDSLWVASLDGEGRELLTAAENQVLRWHPAWSPDGNRLAVLSVQVTNENVDRDEGVKFEVLVVDRASGDVKQRCPFPAGVIEPSPLSPPSTFKWSPSGRYVLLSWESSVVVDLKRNRSIRITMVTRWPSGRLTEKVCFSLVSLIGTHLTED